MKEELLNEKETRLDDLGNSQPAQMAKDTKFLKLTGRKACLGEKAEGVAKLLLITQKDPKFWGFSPIKDPLKRLRV